MRILPRNSPWLAIVCLAAGALWAGDDPFLGKWKVNQAKSVLMDEMKVTSLGDNKYSFDFGGGSPETIVADGTDQQGNSGTTMSTTIISPNEWRGVRKKAGKVLISAIWTLSKDGNTLHDDFTFFTDDGKTSHLVYVYERRGTSGSGFAGDWVSTSGKVDSEIGLEIQPYGSGGLSFSSPGLGLALKVKIEGNDSPSARPDAPPASTFSGRRVNQQCVELTNKAQTIQYEVSTDLKTLTMRVRPAGESEPKNILVFDRE
jgi:hypothetical protein